MEELRKALKFALAHTSSKYVMMYANNSFAHISDLCTFLSSLSLLFYCYGLCSLRPEGISFDEGLLNVQHISTNFNIELSSQVITIQPYGYHMTIVPTISCAMITFKIFSTMTLLLL